MKNNFNIEDYELIQDYDNKKKDWLCIIVIFLMTIGILIILCKWNFKVYEKQELIKKENEFFIIFNSKELSFLESNQYIYINRKKYAYDIIRVDDDYSTFNNNIYQTVYINPYNYKTDATVTEFYILKSNETIYNMIIHFIKGGFG